MLLLNVIHDIIYIGIYGRIVGLRAMGRISGAMVVLYPIYLFFFTFFFSYIHIPP